MKKLLLLMVLGLVAAGCAVTNYPVITDARGDFDDIVRTGHKAYIIPTSQIATIWADGSDEWFSMVYQNQYGDQQLYTFNNYDPTASVYFLDQTYCDWRYDGPEIVRAWNPAPPRPDNPFDYEFFPEVAGSRSLSILLDQGSRLGECGDAQFIADKQAFYGTFAELAPISWRGETAYLLPIDSSNTTIALDGTVLPIYGSFTAYVTKKINLVVPVTPNARHELSWLLGYVTEHGNRANLSIDYNGLTANMDVAFMESALRYNLNR